VVIPRYEGMGLREGVGLAGFVAILLW
jgi:hypothetical protein